MEKFCENKVLTKEEKKVRRIAVINDVLKTLKYLNIEKGCYITPNNFYRKEYDSFLEIVDKKEKADKYIDEFEKCNVCAKGALFLSHIRLYDGFTVSEVINYTGDPELEEFDAENFDLIEMAFECWDQLSCGNIEKIKACEFGSKYTDLKERLKAILENMLENDGVFTP